MKTLMMMIKPLPRKKMPENPSEEQIITMLPTLDEELCMLHPTLKEKNITICEERGKFKLIDVIDVEVELLTKYLRITRDRMSMKSRGLESNDRMSVKSRGMKSSDSVDRMSLKS